MSGNLLGFAIESLVAVLLVATIGYCALLNRRLARLRTDESVMRETIVELVAATHGAERAIAALRATVGHCEETLGERLGRAETVSGVMAEQLGAGEEVIQQITRIAKAAREHATAEAQRETYAQRDAVRELARQDARLEAELGEAARVDILRRQRTQEAAAPVSRSAATAAAAELFATRMRALNAGSAG